MNIIPSIFQKEKKEEKAQERPSSGTVQIKGKMKDAAKLEKELKSMSLFHEVSKSGKKIEAIIVESTDRNKKPYLYITFSFSDDSVEVYYSITPEVPNPTLRKLNVLKSVFTTLSLLEAKGAFQTDREELYAKTMEAFEISSSLADVDSLKMKYELERYAVENAKNKEEVKKLKNEKEGLNHELLGLEKRCQLLDERVAKLESLTNGEIDREIVKWAEDHYGKLNSEKFCDSFNVSAQRLEERLDALSKKGGIKIV